MIVPAWRSDAPVEGGSCRILDVVGLSNRANRRRRLFFPRVLATFIAKSTFILCIAGYAANGSAPASIVDSTDISTIGRASGQVFSAFLRIADRLP